MSALVLLFSLFFAISQAQVLVFSTQRYVNQKSQIEYINKIKNFATRNSCISTPCDITNAAYWIPSISPSPTTSLLITSPYVSLFLNTSLSVQNVTLSNNSILSIIGTGQVYFQNLVVESSNFSSNAPFTTETLRVLGIRLYIYIIHKYILNSVVFCAIYKCFIFRWDIRRYDLYEILY
jgi:hypothetical protein